MRELLKQLKIYTGLMLIITALVPFGLNEAATLKDTYPKRANYYLSWDLSNETADSLAKWDLVILDMEHQVKNKEKLLAMKQKNPHLILLAYITSQEIRDDATSSGMRPYTPLRYDLASGIQDSWWLKNSSGAKISWWPGTHLLNITAASSGSNGNWGEYLAQFVSNKIAGSGLWDGVFFDNTWNSLTEKVGANLDLNGDGVAESRDTIESSYRLGLNNLAKRVRELTQNRFLVMGNDGDNFTSFNGMMFENFPYARGWSKMMQDYTNFPGRSEALPNFSLINANTANSGGRDDYQLMRYGLASNLLGNGYYSFDLGDRDHGQTWWYDEYDISLGTPLAAPYLVKNHTTAFGQKGLWRRDFQNGLVLVNSGDLSENIDLGGEYEKVKGLQDPTTNDGMIVSSVTIPAHDGLILVRPIDKLTDANFFNGAFVRFYNSTGRAVRSGFFAYDNRFRGGASLFTGTEDNTSLIVAADKNQIKIYANDNLVTTFLPFGANYKGDINLVVDDLDNDGRKEIVAGMANLGTDVRIFDLSGKLLNSFTAFPAIYKKGVSVAIGDVNGSGEKEIIAGLAKDRSLTRIYSNKGRIVSTAFYAFGSSFKGGVNLASGDVNGDGKDEIIAGAGTGKPEIRLFNDKTKQLKSFLGGSSRGKNGIKVTAGDIDNNGIMEIIAESTDVFSTATK